MRVERAARTDAIEAKVQAVGRGDFGQPLHHLLRLVDRGAVLPGKTLGMRNAFVAHGRRGRVELERAPSDLDRISMRELRESGFEASLADIAPGADDVGPNIDAERLHGRSNVGPPSGFARGPEPVSATKGDVRKDESTR